MTTRHEARQSLLHALRSSGSYAAAEEAGRLESLYHAQEMAGLCHDSYDAAKNVGTPDAGWARVSATPGLLRELLPDLDLDDAEIRELLHPTDSGLRAEIYIPDPAVLGPGFKPTLVFKGSRGEVIENGVLRDTSLEDFLGNNLPQSIGKETRYYTGAMELALTLERAGLDFDIAGHSLGAGMASASSAVTGMRTVTFNAAGLHPDTAPNFLKDKPGAQLFDTSETVTAWQVQGEILNDGVQQDIRGMSDLQRERMATLITHGAAAVQSTPAGRDYLEHRLLPNIPESSHPAVRALLEALERGEAASMIQDMPEAAGKRMPPLAAMTQQEQALVARDERVSMAELHQLGGPILTVLAMGARGASAGAQAGEVVANGGRALGDGLANAGDAARSGTALAGTHIDRTWQGAGVVLAQGTQAMGEFTAQARMVGAHGVAAIDHAQGWAQAGVASARGGLLRNVAETAGVFSDTWREGLYARADRIETEGDTALERNRREAAAAIEQGRAAAQGRREVAGAIADGVQAGTGAVGTQARSQLVYVGERLDSGFEVTGARVTQVTSHAPTVGAGFGALNGVVVGGALAFDPRTPRGIQHWSGAIELAREAGPALSEAVGRHGMASAVLPSLARHVAEQEAAAREMLREHERRVEAPTLENRSALLSGGTGAALERLLSAVRSGDTDAAKQASSALMETPGAQAWLADGQARLMARDQAATQAPEGERFQVPQPEAMQRFDERAALVH
ncbi:hypothetical protein [Luteimonas sp. 3794]|uniref:hypothetical protein n=1 Tax=Luteimonas sp. 3794 TaxID=2817730 RepID=UPI00285D3C2E|nr:hypothetical protein [Luteimonas sp. 3794]MDR6993224.1 hypothetical protein [Luteimonas sp. 3794]